MGTPIAVSHTQSESVSSCVAVVTWSGFDREATLSRPCHEVAAYLAAKTEKASLSTFRDKVVLPSSHVHLRCYVRGALVGEGRLPLSQVGNALSTMAEERK